MTRENPTICTPCGEMSCDDKTGACAPLAANPSGSGWLWVGAAVALGAVAWLVTRSTKPKAWTCRAGMECTHHVSTNSWNAKNLIDQSLAIYDAPPENLSELTLDETGPGGSWHKYVLTKPAVLKGLPDVYGSLL